MNEIVRRASVLPAGRFRLAAAIASLLLFGDTL
jgi:hypothetical protein